MPILFPANMTGELYVRAMTNAYKRGVRVYDPDYAHIQDPEAFDKLRRDPEIAHAMMFRKHLIAGRDWFMKPASDSEADAKAAKIVEQCLKEVMRFASARFNLADAVFRGSTFSKIVGKRVVRTYGEGEKRRKWWVPKQLIDMDRWRFRQVPVPIDEAHTIPAGSHRTLTKWEYWDTGGLSEAGEWKPLTHDQRRQLIVHMYFDSEATLGYGRGLLEALYHFYWAKTQVMREGLQGIERWAQGWITAEIEGMRLGSTDRDNDEQIEAWLTMLEKMRGRHVGAHGKDEKITVHESSGAGHEMVMSMLAYLDQGMTRLILAGLLPTGGGNNFGSLAKAREEADSTESLIHFDRELLGEDLTRDLVTPIWVLNRPNFVSLGLGDARMPKYVIRHQQRGDPTKGMEVVLNALQAGISLRRDEVYESIGFSPPNPHDLTIDASSLSDTLQGRSPLTGRFQPALGNQGKAANDGGAPLAPHQQASGGATS